MSAETILIIALVALALALAWSRRRARRRIDIEAALPPEFKGARLILNEPRLPLRRRRPVAVAAKPDRAYRLSDGTVALLELKTRTTHQVYEADVAQLSLQRYVLLAHARFSNVRPDGYVATIRPADRSVRVHRVRLLSEPSILQLVRRYDDLLARRAEPNWPPDVARCRNCPHLARCAQRVDRTSVESREVVAWNNG